MASPGPRRGLTLSAGSLLLLLLPGCFGAVPDAFLPSTPAQGPGFEARFDSSTAGVQGLVYDASFEPVSGARVVLQPGGREATADEEGFFVFDHVEPGAYKATASAPDHDLRTRTVQAQAGRGTFAFFTLELLERLRPHHVPLHHAAYIACGAGLVFVSFTDCGALDEAHAVTLPLPVGPNLTTWIVAVPESSSERGDAPLHQGALRFELKDEGGGVVAWWRSAGNETVVRHERAGPDAWGRGNWTLTVAPDAWDPRVPRSAAAGPVWAQRVDIYITLAYNGLALPPGYTGLPPA